MGTQQLLHIEHVSKAFPGVQALSDVHFDLYPREIHCLMGENGAGKSTFIKVITGVHRPDSGTITVNGIPVNFQNPRDTRKYGIAAIYQHVTAYPDLTVAENIFMGHEKVHAISRLIHWKAMHREAQQLLDSLGAGFTSHERMGNLSVARQQIVEIAKALSSNARILIMDEPTAALTQRESEELYRITENLRDNGVGIIFISHRLEDIWRLADRVTVFRDGRYINTWHASDITQQELVVAMVGREITQLFPKRQVAIHEEVLEVQRLSRMGYFRDISFSLRKGEILAITGLVGAGRTELCETLYGLYPADQGRILLNGSEVKIRTPRDALHAGIGCLPEDRQLEGLILPWEIGMNITLPSLRELSHKGWLRLRDEDATAGALATRLNVRAPSIFTRASALSGGNQQKIVVAKILGRDLQVIILDEPTKGVDVGAKAAIYEIIGELAEQGFGIIFVSSEMQEVLGMSDRIVVMRRGLKTAELITRETSQEEILKAAMVTDGKVAVND